MSNDPQADLIYAILAMDSYNRGYGAGISELDPTGDLGNFSILDIPMPDGSFNAGFYAIAYRNAASGETVISYRGTDYNSLTGGIDPDLGGADNSHGYGIALGATQAPQSQIQGTQ